MRVRSSSGKAATGLLVAAVAGLGLTAALGAGYTVAHATLSDPSAYVAKGDAVSHVNGEARRTDATSDPIAKPDQGVDVVALPGGKVAAVNRSTGTVTVQDGGTMSTTATVQPAHPGQTKHPVRVVASGSGGWLVDQDGSSVRRVVNGNVRKSVHLDGAPVDAAPGPDGSLLVLTKSGQVLSVAADDSVHKVSVDPAPGGALTTAAGHSYLVTADGAVIQVDAPEPAKVAAVNGPSAGPDGRMLVGSAANAGPHVLVVIPGGVAVIDPQTGQKFVISDRAGSHTLGQPVEYRDRVYVPDFSTHAVLVLDERTQLAVPQLKVPGSQATFALFVSGGRLWANDQYAQHLLELDSQGPHTVDKGTGNGTRDDRTPKSGPRRSGRGGAGPTGPVGAGAGSGSAGGNNSGGHGGGPPGRPTLVTLPRFGPHTVYQDACQQISNLGPACMPVSRDADGVTDEVIATTPAEGSRVPSNSSVTVVYVGPSTVPSLPDGTTPVEACQTMTAAGLRCSLAPAPRPAADPSGYGTVADTNPQGGTQVHQGTRVTVHYFDTFTMPNYVGNSTKGADTCSTLQQYQLQLPSRHKPVAIACSAPTGSQAAPKNDPSRADVVYAQSVPAGSTYRPGATAPPVQLTVYNSQAVLTDYRLSSGNQISAQDAVTNCSQLFDCQLAPQTVLPVDGTGTHLDWIGRVAAIHDANGADLVPGRYYAVGSATAVRIVAYGGDNGANNSVPNVAGQNVDQACANLAAAGFQCVKDPPIPAKDANIALGQSPGPSEQPLGTQVHVTYSDHQAYPLNVYSRNSDPAVHIVVLQPDPVPAGYTLTKQVGWAYEHDSYNVNWQLREFHGNCVGHTDNVLYSHGAPSGCMANGFTKSAASLVWADNSETTCSFGTVWIWRVSDNNGGGFDVVLGTANRSDQPYSAGYAEPMGCVFPS